MTDVRPPRFGEADGKLSYGTYLKVPELLSLQELESDPPAHDELLFIIVHQVYELWFKQLLFELTAVRDSFFNDEVGKSIHYLARVNTIERVVVDQIPVLETMSPQDFLEFRTHLAPASGFQSVQFREIEFLSGSKDEAYLERLSMTPEELARLKARLEEPSVWDGFCSLLGAHGLEMPADDPDARRESLLTMARDRDRFAQLWFVAESLVTHDQLFALWRGRHVLMVERQIGTKMGTGGSTGAPYLRTTLDKRFYPELWELRSFL
ncbi:MAG TPA: tryptophan 2,3-dioxygenase family protein [Actinomycetota bacterium]|nr:tryptophan 2,3-dioxygenase family protein [Actinomycetota bacterium]